MKIIIEGRSGKAQHFEVRISTSSDQFDVGDDPGGRLIEARSPDGTIVKLEIDRREIDAILGRPIEARRA